MTLMQKSPVKIPQENRLVVFTQIVVLTLILAHMMIFADTNLHIAQDKQRVAGKATNYKVDCVLSVIQTMKPLNARKAVKPQKVVNSMAHHN